MLKSFLTRKADDKSPGNSEQIPVTDLNELDNLYLQEDGNDESTPNFADGDPNQQQDPRQSGATGNPDLQTLIQRLDAAEQTFTKRLSDKDRHITSLEEQIRAMRTVVSPPQATGGQPPQETDPGLDEDTLEMFRALYEKDPATAAIEIMNHGRREAERRMSERLDSEAQQRQRVESLQKVQANIERQLRMAAQELGEYGERFVREYVSAENNEQLAGTTVGQILIRDKQLAMSHSGLYNALAVEALRQAESQESSQPVQTTSTPPQEAPVSVSPDGHTRSLGTPNVTSDRSIEDRIGDSIVKARVSGGTETGTDPNWAAKLRG